MTRPDGERVFTVPAETLPDLVTGEYTFGPCVLDWQHSLHDGTPCWVEVLCDPADFHAEVVS